MDKTQLGRGRERRTDASEQRQVLDFGEASDTVQSQSKSIGASIRTWHSSIIVDPTEFNGW
jgi:hypothetical protein